MSDACPAPERSQHIITIRLPDELYEQLKEACRLRGVSMNHVVVEWLQENRREE